MNRVARTFLNLMRIEVLLGIGLVLWVFSIEAKAQTWVCEIKDEQRIYNKNTSTEWTDILSKADWLDQPIINKLQVVDEGVWWIRLIDEEKPRSVSYTTLNKSTNEVVIVSIFDGKSTAASDKAIPIVAQGNCKIED
jgi:hypothetical protein